MKISVGKTITKEIINATIPVILVTIFRNGKKLKRPYIKQLKLLFLLRLSSKKKKGKFSK